MSQFNLLKNTFEEICDYYIEECRGDLAQAKERIMERLYDDINAFALDMIESITQERNIVSHNALNNEKMIDQYLKTKGE